MWDGWEVNRGCLRRSHAVLQGYSRVFNKSSVKNWGTKNEPCPTLNLKRVTNGLCRGLAFQFADDRQNEILTYLTKREGGFSLCELTITLEDALEVVAVVPIYAGKNILADTTPTNLAPLVRLARGSNGICLDYINGIARKLAELGIEDPTVTALSRALKNNY